ncbi:uncharacterized protein [Dermacentor andersoni]|uniref:uncharacterized protein n=1 Tax=Dermacentor andersoni TaxID=34620 RepID=UPI002415F8CE|nr:uncharacterized protein LOC129380411 [Dermacentor andersoni]XP_054917224.1 uncharacterized protein LOC129380411 [Dermacentor andersoni]XP_054917225.1 uncharacterized protein LOC129380411 [Dermacentor andersoni]
MENASICSKKCQISCGTPGMCRGPCREEQAAWGHGDQSHRCRRQQRMARELRDWATASMAALHTPEHGQLNGESSPSYLLLSMYDECTEPPVGEMVRDPTRDDSCVSRLTQEGAAIHSPLDNTQAEETTGDSDAHQQAQAPTHKPATRASCPNRNQRPPGYGT